MKKLISFTFLVILINVCSVNCEDKAENKLKIGIKKRVRIVQTFMDFRLATQHL